MARNISKVTPPKAVNTIPKLTRVAAYARVSSGKDAMLNSLSAQVSYYSELIQKHSDWKYAGVYADEAVSGTKDNRAGFNGLLADCRAGKIDMVITKSISRFARNTVTLLETVRELKLLGIDVLFERENIYSLSGDGEVMLTILASFAQEESLSVSENCKWRIRDRFKQGEPNNCTILGYRLVGGKYYIMPEEAEIVRLAFSDYLSGMGRTAIAQKLNALGYESRLGKSFAESSISVILQNEKYVGNTNYDSAGIQIRVRDDNAENGEREIKLTWSNVARRITALVNSGEYLPDPEGTPFWQQYNSLLNREIVDALVDSIIVYDSEHIEIIWKFADEYEVS